MAKGGTNHRFGPAKFFWLLVDQISK